MRLFSTLEVDEALAHAAAGGQALHLHRIIPDRRRAPRCFVAAVDRGEPIAHLFDRNGVRLRATARRLGVRVIVLDRAGTERQHVDLCAGPLRKAYALLDPEDNERLATLLAEFAKEARGESHED